MKTCLLMLFGVFPILISFTSCIDNKEIDITYHYDVTAEVNPNALYEKSGIDLISFQEMMALDIFGLQTKMEVTLLVYNKDGSLNQRVDKTVDTLLPFTMDLSDLDEDDYTIVIIQQMVLDDTQHNDILRAWELENTSEIKDVRIKSITQEIPWFMCLGIKTQEASIKKDITIKVDTELTGSFVDVNYENLNYSKFNWSALCFGDQANGLYLNPELQGQSKYYYENRDLFRDNYWSIVYSYYSDVINLSNACFFLDAGKINYCFKFDYFENYDDIVVVNIDYKYQLPSNDAYFEAEKGKLYSAFCYYNGMTDKFNTYMGLESEFKEWYDSLDKWNTPPDHNEIELPDNFEDPNVL